ncbi:hypothetical protein [Streptomyces sp. NBC_00620]|uniref:hypothetical protein n=1 Tax=Streptomyces sp. NBC_00620 TaxID=2903666 RepID=UPI00224DCB62|nr:hypothetical protein [Streptomyces sp. NBC_00620]MCX4976421.1 hypothetical protein [Streptomyces sp. NBC_00620]
MSRATNRAGVRVNRRAHYVHVESATVRDARITFRALGLLTYLLDQSEDWKVRSEQLSKGEGREGRDAVRKALHELAAHGYYRLERRQFRNGQRAMGTAISEFPVEQWAADYQTFDKKLDIPVVEQGDSTYLVAYPDGTFGADGFELAPRDGASEKSEAPEEGERIDEKEAPAKVRAARTATPGRVTVQAAAAAEQKTAERRATAADKAAEKTALDEAAAQVATWWWDHAKQHLGAYVGAKGGFVAMRGQVRSALVAGYSQKECARALQHARRHWPSAQQWQDALGVATNHIQPHQRNGRVAYSDSATWGSQEIPGEAPAATASDDAAFGVLET